jgi:hypothetical protein
MEKLGASVGEDVKKLMGGMGGRVAKAKEGLGILFEALGGNK